MQDQILDLDLNSTKEKFSDVELKLNEIMNFLSEKEESGEGISNPEDAKHLIEELRSLED